MRLKKYHSFVACLAAALLLLGALELSGVLHSLPFVAVYGAAIIAGAAAGRRIVFSTAGTTLAFSLIIAFTSLSQWLNFLFFNSVVMSPFVFVYKIMNPVSGSYMEVLFFALFVSVAGLGGAVGSAIFLGVTSMNKSGRAAPAEKFTPEIERLSRRLELLKKERNKLEEELKVCDIIEQGAKNRIAKNEISQSDYDSIVSTNENYRQKLKIRVNRIGTEINQLTLDIEARRKATRLLEEDKNAN